MQETPDRPLSKPCLFYGAVLTPAEKGIVKAEDATQLLNYDSVLYFGRG